MGLNEKDVREVIKISNFMQKMKMLIWEKSQKHYCPGFEINILPKESDLDDIAIELYDYLHDHKTSSSKN